MQGIAVDDGGRAWTAEHGLRRGDELDLIIHGGDYGWPHETYGTEYSDDASPLAKNIGRHDLNRVPVLAWLPAATPSGMTLDNGFHETWDGDLRASTFKGDLLRIRIHD